MNRAAAFTAVALTGAVAAAGARRMLAAVTVRGGSMQPALLAGDVLLVLRRRGRWRAPERTGRIVVVQRPDRRTGWSGPADPSGDGGWYVKRVAAVAGDPVPSWMGARGTRGAGSAGVPDGALVLLGDHPASEDSKQWGFCPVDRVYGVVLLRLPSRRTGSGLYG